YGLVDEAPRPGEKKVSPALPPEVPPMPVQIMASDVRQPATPEIPQTRHINVMLPSLARGGAERSVIETLQGLGKTPATSKLFLLADVKPCYDLPDDDRRRVYRLHAYDLETKMRLA